MILEGAADVVVADGFSGNVALKTVEGTVRSLLASFWASSTPPCAGSSAGYRSVRPPGDSRSRLDPETYGGGYLLGLRGLVVIAHGSSSHAIANAIRLRRAASITGSSNACRSAWRLAC